MDESNKPISEPLTLPYDYGEILDLEVHDGHVLLLIQWISLHPKPHSPDCSRYDITASDVKWEHVPDLPDPHPWYENEPK